MHIQKISALSTFFGEQLAFSEPKILSKLATYTKTEIMKHFLWITAFSLAIISCKKEEPIQETPSVTTPVVVTTPEVEVGSNDESARSEFDKSIGDAMSALESYGFGSRSGVVLPCGIVSVDTTNGKYVVNYGSNCGLKKLSGTITGTLIPDSAKWKDKGAVMKLDYKDYRILFEVNNQTITMNGSIYITNVNGGFIVETILTSKIIERKVRGSLSITFDNGATRKWNVFKKRVYQSSTGKAADLTVTFSGDSGTIAELGINKAGNEFVTNITTPFVYQNCNTSGTWAGPYVLTKGSMTYATEGNSLTAEAGFQLQNNSFVAVNDCSSLGYKLTWNIGGKQTEQYQAY